MKRYKSIFKEKIRRIKAPNEKFRKTKNALNFIDKLKWDDIVLNGVYDPESNIYIIEPGDTKQDFKPQEWGMQEEFYLSSISQPSGLDIDEFELYYNVKKSGSQPSSIQRKDRASFTQNDISNISEYEYVLDTSVFEQWIVDISAKVGQRIANIKYEDDPSFDPYKGASRDPKYLKQIKDFLNEYLKGAVRDYASTKEEAYQWAEDAVGDVANNIVEYPDSVVASFDMENAILYLQNVEEIRYVQKWIADEIFYGIEEDIKKHY